METNSTPKKRNWFKIIFLSGIAGMFIMMFIFLYSDSKDRNEKIERINKVLNLPEEKIKFLEKGSNLSRNGFVSYDDYSFVSIDYTEEFPDTTEYLVIPKGKSIVLGFAVNWNHTFWNDSINADSVGIVPANFGVELLNKSKIAPPTGIDFYDGQKYYAYIQLKITPPDTSIAVCKVRVPVNLLYATDIAYKYSLANGSRFDYEEANWGNLTFNLVVNF